MANRTKARSTKSRRKSLSPDTGDLNTLSPDLGSLFAARPLILGEAADEYDLFLAKVTAAVKPADVLEAIWVRDVVDLMWESQRLRRLKANLLVWAGQEALDTLFKSTTRPGWENGGPLFTASELAVHYVKGDKDAIRLANYVLDPRGMNDDTIMAQMLAAKLPEIERLIAGADARRNRALSEIERHREALARKLRMTATEITDVPSPALART